MTICLKRKFLLLVLGICIVFSVAFAISLAAQSFNHICCKTEKSGCLPCAQIETANSFFKTLKLAILFVFFAAGLVFYIRTSEKYIKNDIYHLSPVTLKVRFNT